MQDKEIRDVEVYTGCMHTNVRVCMGIGVPTKALVDMGISTVTSSKVTGTRELENDYIVSC